MNKKEKEALKKAYINLLTWELQYEEPTDEDIIDGKLKYKFPD